MQICHPAKTLLGAVLFVLHFHAPAVVAQSAPGELVLLSWSEYIDPELVAKFETRFNAKLRQVFFESDDLRDHMLLETDAQGYDLVMVNGIAVDNYRKQGWLSPVDHRKVPNLDNIDARWRDAFAATRDYAVPYFWGTLGIAYRSDLVREPPSSWMDLFRPDESLRGRIGMVESSRDLLGMALKALGHSANSDDANSIQAAEELLLAQKPFVNSYAYVNLDETSRLVTGSVVMTMLYNGDALMVQEHHGSIEYVVPEEGGNLWVDYLVVMEGSKRKDLAWAFINFLNEPGNAAQLAQYVYYPSPNRAARELLPREFLDDEIIFPNEDIIAKSEAYQPVAPRAQKKRATAFARLMH